MISLSEQTITNTFRQIEEELIASMIGNMDQYRAREDAGGYRWPAWQNEQQKLQETYRQENRKKYAKRFDDLNNQIKMQIRQARDTGRREQEASFRDAVSKGFQTGRNKRDVTEEAFRRNERKLDTLSRDVVKNMEEAEHAVLRMAEDQYRKAVFNAPNYAEDGAGSYEKAVDLATKDMLRAGLNCVEYKNGTRHTLSDYADMAIRTADKRAYLQGAGEVRREWGLSTVIMNKQGNPCPKCIPWIGKILIDDIWSGGDKKDGDYPLMSEAVAAGLYHPRCRDSHATYFPGISERDDAWSIHELKAIEQRNKEAERELLIKRQTERYSQLSEYSLGHDNKKRYRDKVKKWEQKSRVLTVDEEGAIIRYVSPDSYVLNDKMRRGEPLTAFEEAWIMDINKALNKLPEYEGHLNRTLFLSDEDAERFFDSIRDEISFPQFISTTKTEVYDPEGSVQLYIQDSKCGKDLGMFNDMEHEVLYPVDFPFRVVNKVKQGDQYYILLEEAKQ